MDSSAVDFDRRPILVFWETTKACGLACRHCRASAIPRALPEELSTGEACGFLEQLGGFGRPRPVLVATGGDVLERADLGRLAVKAVELRLPLALAPSVTPLLSEESIAGFRRLGVKIVSISLDGASSAIHDGVRGVPGHFEETLTAIRRLRAEGLTVQVNSVVMRDTVAELPSVARIVKDAGAAIWEVFFLVQTGRGAALAELSAEDCEQVCHFLLDASRYGMIVRTVEAPFFRRVVAERAEGRPGPRNDIYQDLRARLRQELGRPQTTPRAQTKGTRDGRGVIFVGHDGEITPSGFLPLSLGNVRRDDIVRVYQEHPLLREIRAANFAGRCGRCPWRQICGGSRARAYAASGDPLGEDPACPYQPQRRRLPTSLRDSTTSDPRCKRR